MPDYTNSGILSRNDRRQNERQPEFTGKINVEGTEYRLAAWVKEKDGRKFFSIKVSEFEERREDPPQETDEVIPF